MTVPNRGRVVLLGMLTRHPVPGMVWLTAQYLEGFRRLGYDVYYVEPHAGGRSATSRQDAEWIDRVMKTFGLADRWAIDEKHGDGECYGMSRAALRGLYRDADVILNLNGGSKALPELCETGRLVYLGTDPMEVEVSLYEGNQTTVDYLRRHAEIFSWGECYGTDTCLVPPTDEFNFLPTRQPVIIDHWHPHRGEHAASSTFTTVGNWRQAYREFEFRGEMFAWSKHLEFERVMDLPRRCDARFELALASCTEDDCARLESFGWGVRPASSLTDPFDYRNYVTASRGEFTVAKEQYARLRSGWFSDRSACYLASGRPVVTSETGFSDVLPSGEGLFGFDTVEEAADAIEAIEADYVRHCAAAIEIARSFFSYDVVLPALLDRLEFA